MFIAGSITSELQGRQTIEFDLDAGGKSKRNSSNDGNNSRT